MKSKKELVDECEKYKNYYTSKCNECYDLYKRLDILFQEVENKDEDCRIYIAEYIKLNKEYQELKVKYENTARELISRTNKFYKK